MCELKIQEFSEWQIANCVSEYDVRSNAATVAAQLQKLSHKSRTFADFDPAVNQFTKQLVTNGVGKCDG